MISPSLPRETTVTRLKIGEKSYFRLIFPLRPGGEPSAARERDREREGAGREGDRERGREFETII